MTKLNWYYCKW